MPRRDERTKPGDKRQIEYRAPAIGDAMQRRADGDAPGFEGYASTWWVVDSYGTAFAPGAFTKTLSERGDKLPHLWQHDPWQPIGFHRAIAEDDRGLAVDVALIDDGAAGSTALKLLKGGVPLAMSHGFRTIRERPATDADPLVFTDGTPEWVRANPTDSVWVIEEVKAYETSTVTFPANEQAVIDSASIRSDRDAAALTSLLDDLRHGRRLDPTVLALITDLAAACADRPDLLRQAPPAPKAPPTTHRTTFDLDLTLAELASVHGIHLTEAS